MRVAHVNVLYLNLAVVTRSNQLAVRQKHQPRGPVQNVVERAVNSACTGVPDTRCAFVCHGKVMAIWREGQCTMPRRIICNTVQCSSGFRLTKSHDRRKRIVDRRDIGDHVQSPIRLARVQRHDAARCLALDVPELDLFR